MQRLYNRRAICIRVSSDDKILKNAPRYIHSMSISFVNYRFDYLLLSCNKPGYGKLLWNYSCSAERESS